MYSNFYGNNHRDRRCGNHKPLVGFSPFYSLLYNTVTKGKQKLNHFLRYHKKRSGTTLSILWTFDHCDLSPQIRIILCTIILSSHLSKWQGNQYQHSTIISLHTQPSATNIASFFYKCNKGNSLVLRRMLNKSIPIRIII